MKRSHPTGPLWLLALLLAGFQNFWMWPNSRLLGGLPVNLLYHVGLCVAASLLLALVFRRGWPADPDEE